MTGVWPLGAQVRTRVGRSLRPDSSMKTINRPSRLAFFERGPGLVLPRLHGILVALDGATLGLLHREPQAAEDAPDLRLPELDPVQALDENAHTLERPQLGAEAVLRRAPQQRTSQCLQLLVVQTRRATSRGHRSQCIDATFIEHRLSHVRGLPLLPASSMRPARKRLRTASSNRFVAMPRTQCSPSIGTTHERLNGCRDLGKLNS